MRFRNWTAVIVVSLAMVDVVCAQLPQQQQVRGQVVDSGGKPVAGADVATFWAADTGTMQPSNGVKTDKEGKFSLSVQPGFLQAVLAMDKERKTGALTFTDGKSSDKPLEIKLGSLVKVHGNFFCKETNKRPTWTQVNLTAPPHVRVAQCASTKAELFLLLPPGAYQFQCYGGDVQSVNKDVVLVADQPDLDLKTIDMEATIIARHIGKAPPDWHVSDARGAKKDVKLSDFKGKWVLVEFWGFW